MKTVTIPYTEELPQTLKLSDDEFAEQVRFLAAAKLYELGKTSSGKAAEMAGLDRVAFLSKLGQYKVAAINLQAEEVKKEIEAVRSLT
jgi:predicted HTH domain antitoxin